MGNIRDDVVPALRIVQHCVVPAAKSQIIAGY